MLKKTVLATALLAAFGAPPGAFAADNVELKQIRDEIAQMKQAYEARMDALEKRLQQAEAKTANTANAETTTPPQEAPPPVAASSSAATGNAFNPAVSLILGGTYANLSQDPAQYRIQGFIPGGDEVGPGKRSFNLGESELTLSANIDPDFSGALTFSLLPDDTVSVEEAFAQTSGLSHGMSFKFGRFLSSIGYLNSQHAHAWDFVDAPLVYQAFFGGQYKPDGLQFRWLAPTDRFVEIGLEAGNGSAFPGSDGNRNGFGTTSLFAHVGDDFGDSISWRAGASYLHARATDRSYADINNGIINAFSGSSNTWIADGILKWAPNGNGTHTNFKLQGEYFHRRENGTLAYDVQSPSMLNGDYASAQSGWYLQGVYQFAPMWRVGLRHDRLSSGIPSIGLVDSGALTRADFPALAAYDPTRNTMMLDYSPSEFSRLRFQFARDQSRANAIDNQFFIQYIMSLGTHGAHSF